MWADIAIFGGIVGAIVSVAAIFAIYSIKRSINTILDRDIVLFDQNFEIKKKVFDEAFSIMDEILIDGNKVKLVPEYKNRVNQCYNDMLCVAGNIALAEEFYSVAGDANVELDEIKVAQFKLNCRKDIGLSNKGSMAIKNLTTKQANPMGETETLLRAKSVNENPNLTTFVTTQPTTQNSRTVEAQTYSAPNVNTSQTQTHVQTTTSTQPNQATNQTKVVTTRTETTRPNATNTPASATATNATVRTQTNTQSTTTRQVSTAGNTVNRSTTANQTANRTTATARPQPTRPTTTTTATTTTKTTTKPATDSDKK